MQSFIHCQFIFLTFDQDLSLSEHVALVTRRAHHQLRQLRIVTRSLYYNVVHKHAFVTRTKLITVAQSLLVSHCI